MESLKFNDLKKKVGVDDIAYSLGYRLVRSAGIGKFIEMSLPDGRGGHTDTLVGKDKWDTVRRVMAKFADEPIPDYGDGKYLVEAGYVDNQVFDPKRWMVTPAKENMHHVMTYFEPRGIRKETVEAFAPYLNRVRDLNATKFTNFNLGFPYTLPETGDAGRMDC